MTTRRSPCRPAPTGSPLTTTLLATLLAALLQGCHGADAPAVSAIQPRPAAALRTSAPAATPDVLSRFIPLSEQPGHETLLALVLADLLPAAYVDGALPARIDRARGEVPSMARPMAYWVTETLVLEPDGRIVAGIIEVIDETDISADGFLQFTFQSSGRITVQGVIDARGEVAWPAVAALLPRRTLTRRATAMHP